MAIIENHSVVEEREITYLELNVLEVLVNSVDEKFSAVRCHYQIDQI